MRVRIAGKIAVFLAACFLLFGVASFAQTNAEINSGIQFNFSTPGARSLGLGGAFLGLADDATAAYSNPAGLTALSKPEVSMEGRRWSFKNEFTLRGHDFGPPQNIGVDDTSGLRFGRSTDSTDGISFASFVYPGRRWALALYRHESANFRASFQAQGPFLGSGDSFVRIFPVIASMDLNVVNLGAAGAFRITDALSLGVGVSYYSLDLSSINKRYSLENPSEAAPGGFFGSPDFSDGNLLNFQTQKGDSSDVDFAFGFLWKIAAKANLGGVYRQGPKFKLDTVNTLGPAVAAFGAVPGTVVAQQKANFNTPDTYGLGISYRPTDVFTITVDYDRVRYSSLTANTVNVFSPPTDPTGNLQRLAAKRLIADDADEFHVGLEYVLSRLTYPLAVRIGSWYDPDHKIRFKGDPGDDIDSRYLAALFRPGENQIHYSAGLGFVFGEKFQLDAAFDRSKLSNTASLSSVFRF